MNKLVSAFVLGGVVVFAVAGCAVEPQSSAEPPAAEEPSSTAEAALVRGGGGGGATAYSCSDLGCICWGDFDCNNMFTDGVCGSRSAKCWERGPGPVYCTCYAGRTASAPSTTAAADPQQAYLRAP